MNVSLTPQLEEFVRKKVATGLYGNASEVVREALRRLIDAESTQSPTRVARRPAKAEVIGRLAQLKDALRERGVTSIALVGSVSRDDGTSDSDIDVLVELESGVSVTLLDLVGIKILLESELGVEVDVITREGLDPELSDSVLGDAIRVF